ncbi:MAG: exopolysaccharide biosynthesis protein [Hyphomonadaceae bacterium]
MNASVLDFVFGHRPARAPIIAAPPADAHWQAVRPRRGRPVRAKLATKNGAIHSGRGYLHYRADEHYIVRRRHSAPAVVERALFERMYERQQDATYAKRRDVEYRYFTLSYPCIVKTREGAQRAAAGDWIMQGLEGELWPLSPKQGRRLYAPLRIPPLQTAPRPHTFAQLVEAIAAMANNHNVGGEREITVGDVLSAAGRRTFGPLLLLIGLFSISPATIVPGMTWFAACLTLLLSLQLALGAKRPWLPPSLLRVSVPRDTIHAGAESMRKWARRVDSVLQPRLILLSEPPFANLAGLACAVAALVTFPLGLIPIAPLAPGLAVAFIGLGLFARDGLLLLVGGVVMAGALWLAYASFT